MKRHLFLILLFLIIACQTCISQSGDEKGFKTWSNEKFHIQLSYPETWREIKINETDLLTLGGLDFVGDTFPDMLSVRASMYDYKLTSEKMRQLFEEGTKYYSEDATIINSKNYKHNTLEFAEITVIGTINGVYAQYKATGFINDKVFYLLSYLYEPSLARNKEVIYQKIINSIKTF